MFSLLGRKRTLVASTVLTVIFALLVFVIVDPYIQGEKGANIVALQCSFDKSHADAVLQTWGSDAAARFNRSIWIDYLFALVYPVAFASWLYFLAGRKGMLSSVYCRSSIYIALSAGIFDWIEDSMELWYINKISDLSGDFFFLHSLAAYAKFAAILTSILCISFLLLNRTHPEERS
jgi:hypothetical protein